MVVVELERTASGSPQGAVACSLYRSAKVGSDLARC